MPVAKMVHTVLEGPLPVSAPWYGAPPQLTQVQMESHNMVGQAGDDVPPTMRAASRAEAAKPSLTFPALSLHVNLMLRHIRQHGLRPKLLQCRHVPRQNRSDTHGISSSRISWNPRGSARSSGNSIRIRFGDTPGNTRTSSASLRYTFRPKTSGSTTTTPGESKSTNDLGAFHNLRSSYWKVTPLRRPRQRRDDFPNLGTPSQVEAVHTAHVNIRLCPNTELPSAEGPRHVWA